MQEANRKRKVRVLIVDDERHIRNLISLIVSSLGAEVVAEAGDGEQALELYQRFTPDIVMLDVNMPKLNGIAVLREIMKLNPRALVIMLTSLSAIDVVKECIDLGARNYILKNLPAEELRVMIGETWMDYLAEIRAGTPT